MKRLLLSLLLLSAVTASAQTVLSKIYTSPVTGWYQIKKENPFIRLQQLAGNSWEDYSIFTRQKAPNIDSTGVTKTSRWQTDNTWTDEAVTKDSFILDNQGRVSIHISDYTQATYRDKTKTIYKYGSSGNKPVSARIQYATPPSYNAYINYVEVAFFYDQNGLRIYDSTYYYNNATSILTYQNYNNAGNVVSQVSISGQDTLRKAYLTYTGSDIVAIVASYLDQDNDEWFMVNCDTFTYDSAHHVLSSINWGMLYTNGDTAPSFKPITKEYYHYTAAGKLDEIINQDHRSGQWTNQHKINIEYDQGNKATIAYQYQKTSGGWETTSFNRYVFGIPTGVNDVSNPGINASIYPNPSKDLISIDLDNPSDHIKAVSIYDLNGQHIDLIVNKDQTIDISGLTNGLYHVVITTDMGSLNRKIMVQH